MINRLLAVLVVLACVTKLAACGGSDTSEQQAATPEFEVHRYTTRARVEALADLNAQRPQVSAFHEPIPEFVGPKRELGMPAMIMPFPFHETDRSKWPDVSEMEVGQKVNMTFEVLFNPETELPAAYYLTSWEPLPDDTQLTFGNEADAGAEDAGTP
ncbi:MAG: copper-binding protein [Planctomycetota bacterium]